ncbi:hypothetical protein [Oricola thermophila]|nr:hypothetical protein [Oricola thermophila]
MAKGQKRSNKEVRKPKQAMSASAMSPVKIVEAAGFSARKKK